MLNTSLRYLKFKPSYWWLIIAVYVACLPSAIIIFNALIGLLSLKLAKWLPIMVMFVVAVTYFLYCRRNGDYHLLDLLLPVCLVVMFVVWLQPNPIKHIHIPEYALLSVLLYLAQKESDASFMNIFVCAALLGFIDELQQGFHPERYFGWKDMVLNSSGALIGCLGARAFCGLPLMHRAARYHFIYFIVAISTSVLIYSCSLLLDVQTYEQFAGVYPAAVLLINVSLAVVGSVISRLTYSPSIFIASFSHALIVLIALLDIQFK